MGIPETRNDLTLEWFNSVFNPKGITVHEFKLTGETGQGQGFMGTLEQAELQISESNSAEMPIETLYVILKTLPTDAFRRKYAANDGFSSREVSVYTEVFEEWDKFMDERKVPLSSGFRHPICYYGAEEGTGESYKYIIVMENLTAPQSDFTVWSPGFTEPLPWTSAAAVIEQIARFHAIGIAYKKENSIQSYYKQFPKLNHVLSPTMFKEMWDKGFAVAKSVIGSTVNEKDIPEGLYDRLDELQGDNARDLVMKWFTDPTMVTSAGNVETICHHDLHSQNLVLSKDHTQAVLFDYQACCVFNPMKDLSFFLLLNCETQDITVNLPRALEYYHNVFVKTMTALQVDFQYSIEEIKSDYDRYFAFSLAHVMTGAPIWIDGPKSNEFSKRRFAMAIIDAYKKGILKFPEAVF